MVREWVEPVGDEEPELQVLCKAFDWMIQNAQYTTVQEVVGQAALFEVNKKEADREPQMPYDSWMDITTVRSYTQVWKQVLCYIVRVEDEDPADRPAYKLTRRQEISIRILRESIREFQAWKDRQGSESDREGDREDDMEEEESDKEESDKEESDKEESDKGESDEEIERMRKVQRDVLRFCIDLLDHPLQDNEYESAMISGLAVLGMRDEG
jgi:hypothetical protein